MTLISPRSFLRKTPLAAVLLALAAAAIMLPCVANAHVGGPWSNDSYGENGSDGTYRAVITGPNTSGLLVLVSSSEAFVQGYGFVYTHGLSSIVATESLVDPPARAMNAVFGTIDPWTISPINTISPVGPEMTGAFEAKITSTGLNFRFEGEGSFAYADPTIPITTVSNDTITSGSGTATWTYTDINGNTVTWTRDVVESNATNVSYQTSNLVFVDFDVRGTKTSSTVSSVPTTTAGP